MGRQTASLPLSPAMSDEDAERVVNTVLAVVHV